MDRVDLLKALPFLLCACASTPADGGVSPNFGDGKADDASNVSEGRGIWPGEQVAGSVESGLFNAHAFEAFAGAEVRAEIERSGTTPRWDTELFLYLVEEGERVLIGEDDDEGYGSLSRIVTTLPEDGHYELVVGAKESAGEYRMTLLCESGECGPAAPSDVTCPDRAQARMWACLEEAADEQDFATDFHRLIESACESPDYLSSYVRYGCEEAEESDEPLVECDSERRRRACGELMHERVGPSSLESRLDTLELPAFEDLKNALASEPCEDSADCYLEISGAAFQYDPAQPPALSELLSFARTHNEVGSGVYPATLDGDEAVDSFDRRYGFGGALRAFMDAENLDAEDAIFGMGDNAEGWYQFQVPVDQWCYLRLFLASFPAAGISFEIHVQECWAG